jgi:hypothetical protein
MADLNETTMDDAIDETATETGATVPATLPDAAVKYVNPFAAFRDRNATTGGFLKCDRIKLDHNTGNLLRESGNNKVVIEADKRRYVVNPQLMIERWVKFAGGKLVDQKIYRTAEGELAPVDREEFGLDLDPRDWPRDGSGKQKDPWSREVYLPMKNVADKELVAFKATGKGAISEIGVFVGMYASADRGGKVPVMEIKSRSFVADTGNTVHVPVFFGPIDWVLWDGQPLPPVKPMAVPIAAPTTPATPTTKALPKRGDMDDDLPF